MGKHNSVRKYKKWEKPTDPSGVQAKKHLGQHFLTDMGIARQIAETLSGNGYEYLIEIGPGTGVLTQFLLEQDVHLLALDLDKESIDYLESDFAINHMKLLQRKRVLKCATQTSSKKIWVYIFRALPLPLQAISLIIFLLRLYLKCWSTEIEFPNLPECSKEVAQRICEREGSKAYGILSVLVQAYYEASYLFTVHPQVFNPHLRCNLG